MSKTAEKIIGSKRTDSFTVDPQELVIPGKGHPLYDPRNDLPLDESMIASITQFGVLEPVVVRLEGDHFVVIAGRQRVKNLREANNRLIKEGKEPWRCHVRPIRADDKMGQQMGVVENEQRVGDNLITKAQKVAQMENNGHTPEEIALCFGVSAQTIKHYRDLLNLTTAIQNALIAGRISAATAYDLALLPHEKQMEAYKEALEGGTGDGSGSGEKVNTKKLKKATRKKRGLKAGRPGIKEIKAALVEEEAKEAKLGKTTEIGATLRWVCTGDPLPKQAPEVKTETSSGAPAPSATTAA